MRVIVPFVEFISSVMGYLPLTNKKDKFFDFLLLNVSRQIFHAYSSSTIYKNCAEMWVK